MKIIAALACCAALYGQTATFTKLANGGITCSTGTIPGYESWSYGGARYSTAIAEIVFPARSANCGGSIYANSLWSVNSATGAFTFVGDFNTGGAGKECPPSGTTPHSRHVYGGTAWAGGAYYFGFGSCNSGINDLWSINISTGVKTARTPGLIGALEQHAFGSDGSNILVFGGLVRGSARNSTWLYSTAADASGFVAQHPTACTDNVGNTCVAKGIGFCSPADISCPPATRNHVMDYDSANGVYVHFGGIVAGVASRQVWAYTVSTKSWVRKANPPAAVPAQIRPLWTYSADLRQFVLYSPSAMVGKSGTIHTYDYAADTWTSWSTNISGPVFRNFASAIPDGYTLVIGYDQAARKVVLINQYSAGKGGGSSSPEVWTLEFPPTWFTHPATLKSDGN